MRLKAIISTLIFVNLLSCDSRNGDILSIYSYTDDSLFFEKIDIRSGELLEHRYIKRLNIASITQKQKNLVVIDYKGMESQLQIFEEGKALPLIDPKTKTSEYQYVTCYNNDYIALDERDMSEQGDTTYTNSLLLFSKKDSIVSRIAINDHSLSNSGPSGNTRYIFHHHQIPPYPSAEKWEYILQIIDLKEKGIIDFDTIPQTNFCERDGYWGFEWDYSFWTNENEVTFLLSWITPDSIAIKIQSYQIDKHELKTIKTFKIPQEATSILHRYIIKDDIVYLSNEGIIYQIDKNNQIKSVYRSNRYTVAGFYF
jgi:hypothetical protein